MNNKTEKWRDIPDYEGLYQVSNLGRVKSLERKAKHWPSGYSTLKERILKAGLTARGYMSVVLYKNGSPKTYRVHQVVAIAFLNHELCGLEIVVNHRNNIKTDNRADNLELVSHRQNSSVDRWRHGKTSKYTGVCLVGKYKDGSPKWGARIYINNKQKHLGYFINEEDAAAAYQQALNQVKN